MIEYDDSVDEGSGPPADEYDAAAAAAEDDDDADDDISDDDANRTLLDGCKSVEVLLMVVAAVANADAIGPFEVPLVLLSSSISDDCGCCLIE